MQIREFLKNILSKVNPTYKIVNHIRAQLESLREETAILSEQSRIQIEDKALVTLRQQSGTVYINDYAYTPKHRDSLRKSRIAEIIEDWYDNYKDEVLELVRKFCAFRKFYESIPIESASGLSPKWKNDFIPPFDAISIYGFLALYNPRYYIEVGSGNTTLFAAQSIRDNNLRTKIISIDPFPRIEIERLCVEIYRTPFEDIDLDFFDTLSAEDIFLIDSSHRSFPNSDVTVFFTEVLPRLPSGILYAIHDILLPSDYKDSWSRTERRWYNEQYLLCAYILGGANGDKIICPNCFLPNKKEFIETCNSLWGKGELFDGFDFGGGFFWLRKG